MDKLKIGAIFEYELWFWYAKFRYGDFSLKHKARGRPQPKVNNDELKAIVESNTFQTTRELASKFSVYIPTILDHLHQIKVKKLDRWVPHELNAHQVKKRFDACVSLLSRNKKEPFLHRIVTCDQK